MKFLFDLGYFSASKLHQSWLEYCSAFKLSVNFAILLLGQNISSARSTPTYSFPPPQSSGYSDSSHQQANVSQQSPLVSKYS